MGAPQPRPRVLDDATGERLRAECIRVYQRYMVEVVEAFQFCPWARRARLEGRVRPYVMLDTEPTPAHILSHIDRVFADQVIDIGLVILPRLSWPRRAFRRFVEDVRAGHAAIHRHSHKSGPPDLAMADFHPDAQPDTRSPAHLVAFIRRTPDPTIQVVRRTALDAVRGPETQGTTFISVALLNQGVPPIEAVPAPLHKRVAEANLATIEQVGVAHVAALLDEIRADRDRAYAAVLDEDR